MAADALDSNIDRSVSWRRWLALAIVVCVTVVTFHGVIAHQFVEWDDHAFLFRNPDMNPPTTATLIRFWKQPYRNLYQPIPYSIWWLIAKVEYLGHGGSAIVLSPVPFHAANLMAHLLAACAVFCLLRVLTKADLASAMGAMLFAVHPLQVEPVDWASSFYTTVNGAFSVGALWLYALFATANPERNHRRRWYFVGATVLYVLALLSKSSAVTIPLIALIIDGLLIRRSFREVIWPIALWVALAIPIVWISMFAQPANYVPTPALWTRPLAAMDSFSFYIQKLFWPMQQTIDYGRTPQAITENGQILCTWIIPAAVLLVAWLGRQRWPWMLAAFLISIAALLPFSGLVKFEFQWFSTVADRYFYVAMLGPAIALAFALRAWRNIVIAPAILVIGLLMIRSASLAKTWSDTDKLIDNAFAVNPRSLVANNVLAYRAARAGDDRTALKYDRAALKIRPTDAAAHANLGALLLRHNQPVEALDHLAVAARTLRDDPQVRTNLGIALAETGHWEQALENLQLACKLDPRSATAHTNLASVYFNLRQLDQAQAEYRAALAIDPAFTKAREGLARINVIRRRPTTAPTSQSTRP